MSDYPYMPDHALRRSIPLSGQILALGISLALAYATAALGAAASINTQEFYRALEQPTWAPPGWLFGPVWTMLYTMMAVAAWLVWRSRGWRPNQGLLLLYLIHLPVNGAWSWLFFVGHSGLWATINIVILFLMITILICGWWRQQRAAALLLLPYLLWVGFASALCITLWWNNAQIL